MKKIGIILICMFLLIVFVNNVSGEISEENLTEERVKQAIENYEINDTTSEDIEILHLVGYFLNDSESEENADGYIEVINGEEYYVDAVTGEKEKILSSEEANEINSESYSDSKKDSVDSEYNSEIEKEDKIISVLTYINSGVLVLLIVFLLIRFLIKKNNSKV